MKRKDRKRLLLLAGVCLIVVVFIAVGFGLKAERNKDVVCYIDEEPIYKEEIAIAASSVELIAEQKFSELSGQSMGEVDWSKTAEGKTGYEYLEEEVEKELVRMKMIQIEAKKNGLCEEISYPQIEKQREKENRQRVSAKSENGIVYGVVSFDEEEYYRYMIDNLDLQNKRYLTQEGVLKASEEEIQAEYEKDPSAFDNQAYEDVSMFVKNTVLSQKYEEYMEQRETKAKVRGKERIVSVLETMKR